MSDVNYGLSDMSYGLSDMSYGLSDESYGLSDGNYVRIDGNYGSQDEGYGFLAMHYCIKGYEYVYYRCITNFFCTTIPLLLVACTTYSPLVNWLVLKSKVCFGSALSHCCTFCPK